MKRFFHLLKLEYDGVFLPQCIIIAVMAVLQMLLFSWRLRRLDTHAPLSHVIDTANIYIVFAIAYVCLLALMAARLIRNYMPSKSIYALFTLPVKRGQVYLAKLASALLASFMLLSAQMVMLMIFSVLMRTRRVCVFGLEATQRGADLYLALLDVSFLRMLFPPDLFSLLFSVFVFFGTVWVTFYVVVCLKSGRKYDAIGVGAFWLVLMLATFPLSDYSRSVNVLKLAAMIVYTIVTGIKGIKLFESAEVVG